MRDGSEEGDVVLKVEPQRFVLVLLESRIILVNLDQHGGVQCQFLSPSPSHDHCSVGVCLSSHPNVEEAEEGCGCDCGVKYVRERIAYGVNPTPISDSHPAKSAPPLALTCHADGDFVMGALSDTDSQSSKIWKVATFPETHFLSGRYWRHMEHGHIYRIGSVC